MVLNRPSFEEKSPVYIDKGKVFLDLGYRFFFIKRSKILKIMRIILSLFG
jgi:hypothetical protein